MKKPVCLFSILFIFCSSLVFPDINFGSRSSAIKVSSGTFNNASSNLTIDGTLVQGDLGSITGNSFGFDQGVLESSGAQALLTAQFDPADGDAIVLDGDGYARVEPGVITKQVNVSGTGNKIEGQLTLANPIVLANATSVLTLGIQNALNKDINLTGGSLVLSDNLQLSDNVKINGPGTVDFNGQRLALGGYYATPWATNVTFVGATDLVLNGKVSLSAAWTFKNKSVINGHGSILDLTNGGSIIVNGAAGELHLNDIYIKGLSDVSGAGKLYCDTAGGKIYLNNVTIELDGALTTLIGNFIIDGCTTVLLKNYNWTIGGSAVLTVNDRLWLDVYHGAGQIKAPNPLFVGHALNTAHVDANIAAGFLVIGADGVIKEVGDRSYGASSSDGELIGGNVSDDLTLDAPVSVAPGETINVTGDVTIDGDGTVVTFSTQDDPQFVVEPGKTVVLENITLSRINTHTFSLGDGSVITVGNNVVFELSEDVDFTQGKIVLSGSDTVLTLRGLAGKRIFSVNPKDGASQLVDIGNGALALQDMQLDGLEFIKHASAGSILFAGNAAVRISQDTDMNFDVEGINNELVLLTDALTLSGAVSFFGAAATNLLEIRFSLSSPVSYDEYTTGPRAGVKPGNPVMLLSGDTGIYLTCDTGVAGASALGTAALVFSDPSVTVRNLNANAFVVEKNSLLDVQELEILDYPVKQQSALFRLRAEKITGQGIDPSFIRAKKSKKIERAAVSSYSRAAIKRAQDLAKINETKKKTQITVPVKKDKPQVQKHKKNKVLRSILGQGADVFFAQDLEEELDGTVSLFRSLALPAGFDTTYRKDVRFDKYLNSNIELDGAQATNFMNEYAINGAGDVVSGTAFNITLKNGAVLEQSFNQDIRLAPDQYINIDKADRKVVTIKVSRLFEVNDNFRVAPGAELVIEFVNSGVASTPVFKFTHGTQFDLEAGAVIRLRGKGILDLSDEVVLNMKGLKIAGDVVQGRQLFTIQDRAILDIGPDVQLRMSNSGTAYLTGVGELICSGNLEPASGVIHLWPRDTDDMVVRLLAGAIWRMTNACRITTGAGIGSLTFESGSTMQIVDGELSFNDKSEVPSVRNLGDTLTRGYIKNATFEKNSKIIIGKNGKISWGPNEVYSVSVKRETETVFQGPVIEAESGARFEYVSRSAAIDPSGYYQGIEAAQIQNKSTSFSEALSVRVLDIAKYFINVNSNLTNGSIEYRLPGASGARKVRTVKGVVVSLLNGDVLEQDRVITNASGVRQIVIDLRRNGSRYTINQDGLIS